MISGLVRRPALTLGEMIASAMVSRRWIDRYVVPCAAVATVAAWVALAGLFVAHGERDVLIVAVAASSLPAALWVGGSSC